MKQPLAVVFCLFGGLVIAEAQSTWGTAAGLTVKLTVSFTAPGTVAKDGTGRPLTGDSAGPAYENEYTVDTFRRGIKTRSVTTKEYLSKQSAFRWGNAQIILAFIESGLLPKKGRAPYTAGWSLMRVTSDTPTGEQTINYFARHRDGTAVAVDDLGLALRPTSDPEVSAASVTRREFTTTVYDLKGEGNDVTTNSFAYSSSFKGLGVGYGSLGVELPGIFTASYTSVLKTEKVADPLQGTVTVSTNILLPGPLILDRIAGFKPVASDADSNVPALIEGTVYTAKASVQNLDTYLVAPPAP